MTSTATLLLRVLNTLHAHYRFAIKNLLVVLQLTAKQRVPTKRSNISLIAKLNIKSRCATSSRFASYNNNSLSRQPEEFIFPAIE